LNPVVGWLVGILLILAGIAGTFVPGIPGTLLVLGGMFLAAWSDGFRHIGWITLGILAGLSLLALVADLLGGLIGAKRVGASRLALAGAAIGALVGVFFGLAGALIGPFLGAAGGELMSRGRLAQAAHVGFGTWVGIAISMVARVVIVFAMLAVFVTSYLL
jgi:uncharacterized protein